MKVDYSKLEEITVKSQEELDMIPEDFGGRIYIEFGKPWNRAVVRKRYRRPVEAWGNVKVVDRLRGGRIEITGNARIVCMPKTIEEYCSFYGIEHDKKKGKFFKCVHKKENGSYVSDNDSSFAYVIGEKVAADYLDKDTSEDYGHGIHIAYLQWVIDYGRNWNDLAILEVEADLDSIVLPEGCPGKVRCAEVKVLREVPLEECGLYGKILTKRRKEREE